MSSDPAAYLSEIELALVSSLVLSDYQVVRTWANTDDGYIRLRATLTNGDFLEATEYFVVRGDQMLTMDYRYQWMDADKTTLRRRWDSTPDHPHLAGFPHHVHVGGEQIVLPSQPLRLIELLQFLERELSTQSK